jgi:YidC/Oxa1 family membrane protein insertase
VENRNYIMAIALSLVILVGWQYFVMGPRIAEEQEQAEMQARMQTSTEPDLTQTAQTPDDATSVRPPLPDQEGVPSAPADTGTQGQEQAPPVADIRIPITTPAVTGSINLRGARLDDLHLSEYQVSLEPDSDTVVLLTPSTLQTGYYAEFGWAPAQGSSQAVPGPDTLWQVEGQPTLGLDSPVTLSWDNGQGLIFTRTISVDDHYMFSVRQSVENTTSVPVTLYPYGLVSRKGHPKTAGTYILHEGLVGYLGEDGLVEVDYKTIEEENRRAYRGLDKGWLGITDKYWATALIPERSRSFRGEFRVDETQGNPSYVAAYLGEAYDIAGGQTIATENLLFAGAKKVALIDRYDEAYNIEQFDLLIDWGYFYFLTKPIFYALAYIYGIVGNFGIAILILTVFVKLFFLPLANKSYASMSRMKKVQPQMKEIQQRYKDDRMAMQKAMMDLYRKEGINPMSGCWPVLIQIPVFFALYKVLYITIEMRHAPFYGWINDLSAPDPTSLFNLFGLFPWSVPVFLAIGAWPIMMGITMWIQMKLNPAPQDPTQAMIFNWMPLFFTFILASFPAGLVIYWTWNNFLSILQQSFIMKRHGVKIELFTNMKNLFSRKKSIAEKAEDDA